MKDPTRHSQGAYYTPRWLAELLLDEAGYDGAPGRRLVDPSCGAGVFLEAAIGRARRWGEAHGEPPARTAQRILSEIHGYERDPAAVRQARAAYLQAMGGLAGGLAPEAVPVAAADVLLDPGPYEPYDLVIGNPPWVRWDYLPEEYRKATLPLWRAYGLFSLTGFAALQGGGKKDLCMLFTYAAADRFLRDGGMLAFLITLEALKSKGAGEGFRRFRIGPDGPPLGIVAAHDFSSFQPFPGATNKTGAILLIKGRPTSYPAPYYRWHRSRDGRLAKETLAAAPAGGSTGPWRTFDPGRTFTPAARGNAYTPVLGANANPYGVFWLEILRALPGGLVEVRNLPEFGKSGIPPVRAVLEAELIYPALRGADVARWRAAPGVHVLLVQDPATRAAHPETVLRSRWPRTLAYLEAFREILLRRALYRRYHQEAGRPFYSQFNVGAGVLAAHKVVWRRMGNDLHAAVVSGWDGPLGRKLAVPLETACFIAVDDEDEAHYICALLNSGAAREYVRSFSAAGRGFATPSAIARVPIPSYDPHNPLHARLAAFSRACHAGREAGGELEALAGEVLGELG